MRSAIATARIESPIGTLTLSADDMHLRGVRIAGAAVCSARDPGESGHPILAEACAQLRAWFAGKRQEFDLPLRPLDSPEGTALRAGIASIPFGETLTYGALAARTGSVPRAVGQACKTNSFPIIIPCHRVVSTSGPEYYSGGGGTRTKTWLIDFEYDHLPPEKRTRLL
jgi:methylated-DNA-[protein]-cysteine S-methyltransferase